MTRIVIIESNPGDLHRIVEIFDTMGQYVHISNVFEDAGSFVKWLNYHQDPSLILVDVSNGNYEAISKKVNHGITSALLLLGNSTPQDEELNKRVIGIIPKPVEPEKVKYEVMKYLFFRSHFFQEFDILSASYVDRDKASPPKVIVRKGTEHIPVNLEDISHFRLEGKLNFMYDLSGNRYVTDYPLIRLERMLGKTEFFRASKTCLVSLNSIRSFRSIDKNKIEVNLLPTNTEPLIISQHLASDFRNWINDSNG